MKKRYYSLEVADRTAEITIFGDITSWPLLESDVTSYNLQHELQGLDADNIDVHINSYGGEVAEALAIYNVLVRHPAKVTTYVDGFACSAATVIFMAGERRIMSKVSNFLVHPAWSNVQGNAAELRHEADNLDAITEQSVTAYMENVTKTREELLQLMSEERFLTPEETLEWGFATEIEETDKKSTATQSVMQLISGRLQGAKEAETIREIREDLREIKESLKEKGSQKKEPEKKPENTATMLETFLKAF